MRFKNILYVLAIILFLVSFVSSIYEIDYLYRDILLIIILILEIFISLNAGTQIKKTTFGFIVIAVIGILLGFNGSFSELLISARAVVLYPALFFVGMSFKKWHVDISAILSLYIGLAITIALFATIEFAFPKAFQMLLSFMHIEYDEIALLRAGLGFGLGSLFVSRQYLGIFLAIAIVFILNINKYSQKKYGRIRWILALWFLALIALTMSRSSILAALSVMLFNLVSEVNSKDALKIIIPLGMICIIAWQIPFVRDSIQSMSTSLRAMDSTLSGRTVMWREYLGNAISWKPNFGLVGSSTHGKTIGAADSSYIRVIIAFGIPIAVIVFVILLCKVIEIVLMHTDKRLFLSLVIVYGIASIAMDLTFIFMICVPVYLLLGYEYLMLKYPGNRREDYGST